jgi:hypothetical protein
MPPLPLWYKYRPMFSFQDISMKMLSNKLVVAFIFFLLSLPIISAAQEKIDRKAMVQRHIVINTSPDSLSSLSVGNGGFAFTADITGMQSFPDYYQNGVPLGTESEWGWHSFPNTKDLHIEQAQKTYVLEGKKISYTVQPKEPEMAKAAVEYFRVNPHRLQLGNIGMEITKKDGSMATINDIKNVHQELDPWSGTITSLFEIEAVPVKVISVCHQQEDALGFLIQSELLKEKRIHVRMRFPFPNGQFKDVGNHWKDDIDQSFFSPGNDGGIIKRVLDTTIYYMDLHWTKGSTLKKKLANYFLLQPGSESTVYEFSCRFSSKKMKTAAPSFADIQLNSSNGWKKFWQTGGAVDFSGSTDKRAFEIERRVVLSQYLTKIQCASAFPPQETGLTYNSWYGKPHLEMHWWHAVHYAQWGRPELLRKSVDWYFTVAGKARAIAKRQGFDGLRWQKMTDHKGDESPSSVGAFLIWQQPHFIYMTEMLYRSNPSRQIINKYKSLVFATADFMASFPTWDAQTKKYNLGKGLIPAQECFDAVKTFNPTYELAYWHWALNTAQQWRIRSGLPRNKKWDDVINNLAPLPEANGVYLATESTPDCYTTERYLTDHPAVLAAYSTLPAADGLDTSIMKITLDLVWKKWKWNDTWGWDFPLTAMTAARLHMPEKAVEALLMPITTNIYLNNGHNYQDKRLTIYLPGNGGVLSAVALMCTGADADKNINIGFPTDGNWRVR